MNLASAFQTSRSFVEPTPLEVDALELDNKLSLRGKTLIQAVVYYLSDSRREVLHRMPHPAIWAEMKREDALHGELAALFQNVPETLGELDSAIRTGCTSVSRSCLF